MSFLGHNVRAAEVMGAVVRRYGGKFAKAPSTPSSGAPSPTHVICDTLDAAFSRADAIRRAARAPASAPVLRREWVRAWRSSLVAHLSRPVRALEWCFALARAAADALRRCLPSRQQVSDSVKRGVLQDVRAYALPSGDEAQPAAAAPPRSPPASADVEGDEPAAPPSLPPQHAHTAPFVPPPPSHEPCSACGRALGWQEVGTCQMCLSSAPATARALHLRFRLVHPNAALVSALSEMAEYEEQFGEVLSADAFRRAAAVLKATPNDINDRRVCASTPCLLL
jgi:hypothetical protein